MIFARFIKKHTTLAHQASSNTAKQNTAIQNTVQCAITAIRRKKNQEITTQCMPTNKMYVKKYICTCMFKHVPKGPSHPHRYKIETKIGKTHKQPGRHS